MIKKFMKVFLGLAIVGGALAGVYYFLTNDKYADTDDFDDLEDEDNDDLQDFLDKERQSDDHYVTLDLTKDKASENDKVIGQVKTDDSNVVKADSDVNEDVEGFSFTDLT
ncbi:MAG: hypothetical protein K6G03_01015 [Lachnospiraceae bacterium]|nr:hypothetical protein [Lachnospiraceae bacterium]